MNDNGQPLDRRRLLAGAAAASAVTVTGLAVASTTGAAAAAPGRPATPLITRDRIATAALRAPDGSALPVAVQADFHARLAAWLAFWSANSPSAWSVPVQVVARIEAGGDALVLHGIRHRRDDELRAGFAAGRRDATHLATLASLHHHFPSVRVRPDGTIRVTDGPAGLPARRNRSPSRSPPAANCGATRRRPPTAGRSTPPGCSPAPGTAPTPPRTPAGRPSPAPACVAGWAPNRTSDRR
ncbi:hypothetical protein [Micromonospora tulbaghiae]|uniref:hypothetical protein n=1 Tax=Micromonospora tulbaghiae TaxID=479978 RepID=UPI001FD04A08|nr:hypothetical protein [Micromonospora tulbaghiae]